MKDCLFVWVPKCAGTSIHQVIAGHGCKVLLLPQEFSAFRNESSVTFGHVNVAGLLEKGYLSRQYFDRVFKFAFVRNPWDRLVSLWSYLMQKRVIRKIIFADFVNRVAEGVEPVGLYNRSGLSQARPMCDWLFDANLELMVDFVGRVEKPEDFEMLREHLKIKDDFPVMNLSEHEGYRQYYTPELIRIVADIYYQDITQFDYRFSE